MKHYGLEVAEGTEITNTTVSTGISFPGDESVGELFFRTDSKTLFIWDGTEWDAAALGGGSQFSFTATSGQTVFTGSDDNGNSLSYSVGQEMVFLNGSMIVRGTDYTATTGDSITLTSGADADDTLQVFAYGVSAADSLIQQSQDRQSYTATAGQTTFAVSYTAGFVDIFLNGSRLSPGTDFTATDGSTIVLTVGASAGALVECVGYTTADVTSAAVRKNVVINGDMRIAQRGTTFTSPASFAYLMDRWRYVSNGTAAHTITQETGGGPNDNFPYWMKLNVTTAETIEASDRRVVEQIVEGYDYVSLRGKTVTLSFWVKDTKTGTHAIVFRSGNGTSSYISEYTIASADTWEFKTVTVEMAETYGTWDLDNGAGFILGFTLAAGSTYHTTADAWQNGNYLATSSTVNSLDSTSNDFGITGVQLEIGPSATAFDHRPLAEELELCERYYQKSYNLTTVPGTSTSIGTLTCRIFAITNTSGIGSLNATITRMRTTPSVTAYSTDGTINTIRDLVTPANVVPSITAGEKTIYIEAQQSGTSTSIQLSGHYVADAEL